MHPPKNRFNSVQSHGTITVFVLQLVLMWRLEWLKMLLERVGILLLKLVGARKRREAVLRMKFRRA